MKLSIEYANQRNYLDDLFNDVVAYRDTIVGDDFLEFLRERLIFLRELLSQQGSIYLHIDCKIGHYVKLIMDEIFGRDKFKNDITRIPIV
jgi:adenine-specific DNA-methyltransferase